MPLSYDDALATNRDKVRFHLQDTVTGSGPKPGDVNFTDDEINGLVTAEGSWQRAVAAGFEILASAWMRYPSFRTDAIGFNRSDIAKGYQEQAKSWRNRFGTASGATIARTVTRADAYSSDYDTIEE
jgi:hypothetical protein